MSHCKFSCQFSCKTEEDTSSALSIVPTAVHVFSPVSTKIRNVLCIGRCRPTSCTEIPKAWGLGHCTELLETLEGGGGNSSSRTSLESINLHCITGKKDAEIVNLEIKQVIVFAVLLLKCMRVKCSLKLVALSVEPCPMTE